MNRHQKKKCCVCFSMIMMMILPPITMSEWLPLLFLFCPFCLFQTHLLSPQPLQALEAGSVADSLPAFNFYLIPFLIPWYLFELIVFSCSCLSVCLYFIPCILTQPVTYSVTCSHHSALYCYSPDKPYMCTSIFSKTKC